MNSLHGLATRQANAIQADLNLLESSLSPDFEPSLTGKDVDRAVLHGQIAASLSGLQRTIDDYENLAAKEMVEDKRTKGLARIEKFKENYSVLKKRFEQLKQTESSVDFQRKRDQLFAGGSSTSTSGQGGGGPAYLNRRTGQSISESPFSRPNPNNNSAFTPRTNAALDEHSFLDRTSSSLDQFIAQGQAVLGDLQAQRDVMKGARRRILSTANTLGLSRETIGFIERRTTTDFIIFVAGVIFTLICFYYIIKWFG